ncbi:MAG: acetylhydrolase [Planctomycetota bacterium]
MPTDVDKPLPMVLVSHGLGGTRESLNYLGTHWASYGYLCVHMQHPGSDDSVWQGLPAKDILQAMRKAASTPQVAVDRAEDVPFVLDRLEWLSAREGTKLHNKIDFERVGIAGHSFGAWSAMAAGGMTVGGQFGRSYGDERIKCIIPLSPPVAKERQRESTYRTIKVPALIMTGTLDTSMINNTTAEERLIPYGLVPGPSDGGGPKYLINFNGADHMTFSGETKRRMRSKVSLEDNKAFHSIIRQSTTAFLDAYLLDDKAAKAWLNDGGFTELVDERGDIEMDAK